MNGLAQALGFLTAIPIRTAAPKAGDLGRAAAWFPLVGLGLGLLLSLAAALAQSLFPPLLAASLLVVLWAALSGGLHLDGLADCGDGLLAAASRERRLEIMRDPRLGAFGGLSLVLFLIVKVAALASLLPAAVGGPWAPAWLLRPAALFPAGPLIIAPVIARWLILLAARQPSARPGGMGADFALGLRPATLAVAAVLPLALAVLGGAPSLLAVAAACLLAYLALRLARARLGGVTGDVFGLVVELSELAVLLTYAALRP